MCRKLCSVLGVVSFFLLGAAFASAHEVTIVNSGKLGTGPELQAGTYRLELVKSGDTSEAAFYNGSELIVQVPVTLASESQKSRQTEVHYDLATGDRVITRIRVRGWSESLLFLPPTPEGTEAR